jgi:hypothetical protein
MNSHCEECPHWAALKLSLAFLLLASPLLGQDSVTAAAGTRLRVEFASAVGTDTSRIKDGVEVHLLKALLVENHEVLPAGTILFGRVLAVRKGNKHTHTFPMLRLAFDRADLPDGRKIPLQASLADLGVTLTIDSEGTAMPPEATKGDDLATVATTGVAGAGIGGLASGGSGAAKGAAMGAGIGGLLDLAAHAAQWDDFTLRKGRKAWLRLDADLSAPAI